MTTKLLCAMLLSALVGGCATYSGWEPTIDSYNDRNAAAIPQDMAECKVLAQKAGSVGMDTLKGAGAGGLIGAAGGAALGAIGGNAGKGAAIGAAAGGIGGAAHQGLSGDEAYKRTYSRCMSQRGHHVIN